MGNLAPEGSMKAVLAFSVADLVEQFEFDGGRLHMYLDYVRGRLVKTEIYLHKDGRVEIQTVNRGQSLRRCLDLSKGKSHLVELHGPDRGDN